MRKSQVLGAVVAGALGISAAWASPAARAQSDDAVLVATSRASAPLVPEASAVDLRGRTWSLRALRGRPVILSLFATWCPACRAEMDELDELQKRFGPSGLVILAVSKEDTGVLSDFARSSGHAVPLLTGSEAMMDTFGVRAWPTTFFIGRDSRILARTVGASPAYTRLLARLAQNELASSASVPAAAPAPARSSSRAARNAKAPARKGPTAASRAKANDKAKDDGVVMLSNSGRRVLR